MEGIYQCRIFNIDLHLWIYDGGFNFTIDSLRLVTNWEVTLRG